MVCGVLVVVLIGVFVYFKGFVEETQYSVVYLTTREVYVGKLSTFPDLQLKDAYILQVAKDEKDASKTNFQITPVSEAIWSPKTMHLVKDNVVFYGPLLSTSKIAQTIAGKK